MTLAQNILSSCPSAKDKHQHKHLKEKVCSFCEPADSNFTLKRKKCRNGWSLIRTTD